MNSINDHIAIVGASGNVGRTLLKVMEKRALLPKRLTLLASAKSAGKHLHFQQNAIPLQALDSFDFNKITLAFFAAGSAVAQHYAPIAAQAGAVVIDLSSHFRMEPDVPLCIPEVNPDTLQNIPRNIIANPNCSAAQFVLAIAPLHRAQPIERIHLATYQSVSGAGKKAMDDLVEDLKKNNNSKNPKSLAFNVIPKIDDWLDNGESKEEWKIRAETAKILDPSIKISTHCVRVPVLVGHSEAAFVRFAEKINLADAKAVLRQAKGCKLLENDYATPIESEGADEVFISRLRKDPNDENALQLWITADNLLKGAALNAVQIAEMLNAPDS